MPCGSLIDEVVGDLVNLDVLVFQKGDHGPRLLGGDADMPNLSLRAQFQQRVQRATFANVLNLLGGVHPAMDLHDVDMVGLEQLQALLQRGTGGGGGSGSAATPDSSTLVGV